MLTVTAIQKAKPTEKQYRIADERGLVLLVRPNGSKLWQLRFRHLGKEKTASLGQYPDVSLSEARTKRDELRKLVAAGSDPVAVKQAERKAKATANENTVLIRLSPKPRNFPTIRRGLRPLRVHPVGFIPIWTEVFPLFRRER